MDLRQLDGLALPREFAFGFATAGAQNEGGYCTGRCTTTGSGAPTSRASASTPTERPSGRRLATDAMGDDAASVYRDAIAALRG